MRRYERIKRLSARRREDQEIVIRFRSMGEPTPQERASWPRMAQEPRSSSDVPDVATVVRCPRCDAAITPPDSGVATCYNCGRKSVR